MLRAGLSGIYGCGLGCGLAAILVAGCLTSRQIIPVSYAPGGAQPSAGRHDYEAATKAIARVMVEELKLPPIETVLIVYPSLPEYESGIATELGSTPEHAAGRTHTVALAHCKYKKVLVNGHGLSRQPWSGRVKILAHEMTHITQFALANSRCAPAHPWLSEGFANWVAYKVLEALKLDSFAGGKETFLASVGRFKSSQTLPLLSQMSSSADWEYLVRSLGTDATYAQAFLAVDFLIERKGFPAVIKYFGMFDRASDLRSNFTAAFGEDVSRFEQAFRAHLQKLT
jgi:hypothetical protein